MENENWEGKQEERQDRRTQKQNSEGHYRKDKGSDLKIACPIFKSKKPDDPDVHIQAFEQYAELKHILEEEWEEYFPHTLKEAARKWYYHYPASKLQSYRKLKKAFNLEYTDDRDDKDILSELDKFKQGKLLVKKYVQKIKELTRRLNKPPSEKRMGAWFLSGFNSKKLKEQEVPAPTKKFTELVHKALKVEQQAKEEKSRHKSSSDYSINASSVSEKSSSSSSDSEEKDQKKKKKGSWSRKIDEMSKKISEISGLRETTGKAERWCIERACPKTTHQKTALSAITAKLLVIPADNSGYNGISRGSGRGSSGDFKRNFNCYKCEKYGHFAAQCPEPDEPAAPEAKQP
ncbi:hypothetical protein L7F22_018325 [Adiantum nelumboides]|nr:hypothetical protein [Adiantum nelumboides]